MRISADKGVNNMSITIKRDTGFTGMGSKVQIKINGEKGASIKYNEQVDIEIPEIEGRLKVTQSGMKSNEIKVKDGDIIKITTTSFNRISMILNQEGRFFLIPSWFLLFISLDFDSFLT